MILSNNKVYQRVGAAILMCGMAALIGLLWPVGENRWKKAALTLENRYLLALVCQGDTLFLTDANTVTGIRGESFRADPCWRTQTGIGYFSWPWGSIKAQAEVMACPYDIDELQRHSAEILEQTQKRVELHQQTMEHVLKEMDYYTETHMKDDDGWQEMKLLHQLRLQEQRRLDSLHVFLENARDHVKQLQWHYIYNVYAYTAEQADRPLPCGAISVGASSMTARLKGKMPKESSSVMSWNFGWDDMRQSSCPEDTVNRYIAIVELPERGTYGGMLKGLQPDGWGTLHFTDGRDYFGHWKDGSMEGTGEMAVTDGKRLMGTWEENHLMNGLVTYADGSRYEGSLLNDSIPDGAGDWFYNDGAVYWGTWDCGMREGFGMYVGPVGLALAGTWQEDVYQGERLLYTEDRVYGIDIARYQHLNRRRRASNVAWKYLRITSLGKYSRKRIKEEKVDYPISFVYVKCTEGVTVKNQYYKADDQEIRKLGIHTGAYHFFQGTPAQEQLEWFMKHVHFEKGDLPPVLDIEPTDAQIAQKWGSDEKLFSEALVWLNGVEKAFGVKPILYVNQSFINKHLSKASEELQRYDLWVARYGEFKPYSRMVYWQLSPDGKVSGIQSDVDINVFNGSKEKFNEYIQSLQ